MGYKLLKRMEIPGPSVYSTEEEGKSEDNGRCIAIGRRRRRHLRGFLCKLVPRLPDYREPHVICNATDMHPEPIFPFQKVSSEEAS